MLVFGYCLNDELKIMMQILAKKTHHDTNRTRLDHLFLYTLQRLPTSILRNMNIEAL